MADSILFNLAGTLINKLGSYVHQELGLLLGVNGELDKLKGTVSAIEKVLLDAEERSSKSHALEDWLSKLKGVFYEIDDLIDEFNYEALRRQVMTRNRRKTKQVRIFFSKSNQIAFSHKMGGKIKEIREKLKVINDDKTQFKLSECVINKSDVDILRNTRDPGDYIPEEEVIGRNYEKKEIIDLLLNSNAREDIAVVAIVGMGGLGKTTIAQSVYSDKMMTKHFELRLWVCISEEFEVKVIIQNIIEYATRRKESFPQMALLQTELRKLVDGKKYLLVMDDVWNEDHEKWNTLKRLLMGGAKGSRILITTRTHQVANTFDSTSFYSLEELNDKNSWLLFEKMAFGGEGAEKDPENSKLVEIGKEIVTKLKGIPLAIRTVGRLLYYKKSTEFWSSFKDKKLYQIIEQGSLKDMLSILMLSYNHLPYNLKQCFLYCAMFPKDYEIQKNEVIMQWIAQSFIHPNDKYKFIDIGEEYFMELLSRSFFQDVTKNDLGDIITCKMHDLMHDLACSIVENECVHDVNARTLSKRTHHVSFDLMSWEELERLPETLSEAKNLRTCFFHYNQRRTDNNFNEIFESVFYNLLRLRTLDLQLLSFDKQNVKFLKCISKLKHLRYLEIQMYTKTEFFMNHITGLYNLEVFILRCTRLKELPRDIKNWNELKHVYLYKNEIIEFLPNSFAELNNLETLVLHQCTKLKELLGDVRNWINLRYLDLSSSGVEFLPDSITQLKNLETLLLRFCSKLQELPRDTKNLINLKHVDLYGCWALTHMPKGLGELTDLQILNFFVLEKDNNGGGLSELNELNKLRGSLTINRLNFCTTSDLPTNAKFLLLKSSLQELVLEWEWDNDSVNEPTIGDLDDDCESVLECLHPHSNLRNLCIDKYRGVKLCNWVSSNFLGCLVTIKLSGCKRLQHLPQFDQFPNLKRLSLRELSGIEYIFNDDYRCSSTLFPSLEELSIFCMPNLKRWWKKGQTSKATSSQNVLFPIIFPCLSKLEIWGCPLLASITCHAPPKSLEMNDPIEFHFDPDESDVVSWKCFESLSYLRLTHIDEWGFLSNWLQHVTTLQELTLEYCQNLTNLPESISNFTSLSKLEILKCTDLMSLPESIGNLTSLTELTIDFCPSLTSLPEGIRHLHCLQSLTTWDCPILEKMYKKETGEDWLKIAHIRQVNHWESPT